MMKEKKIIKPAFFTNNRSCAIYRLLRKLPALRAPSGAVSIIISNPAPDPFLVRRASSFGKQNGVSISTLMESSRTVCDAKVPKPKPLASPAPVLKRKPVIRTPKVMHTMPPTMDFSQEAFDVLRPQLGRHEVYNYRQYGLAPVPGLLKDRFLHLDPEIGFWCQMLSQVPSRAALRKVRHLAKKSTAWVKIKGRRGTCRPSDGVRMRRLIFSWLRHLSSVGADVIYDNRLARARSRGQGADYDLVDRIWSLRERLKGFLDVGAVKQRDTYSVLVELARGVLSYGSPSRVQVTPLTRR